MSDNSQNINLIFWDFFHQMEEKFGYRRWIDKYKIFLKILHQSEIPLDEDLAAFRQTCKFLFLHDHRHEEEFNDLLDHAIESEYHLLVSLLENTIGESRALPVKPEKRETKPNKIRETPQTPSQAAESLVSKTRNLVKEQVPVRFDTVGDFEKKYVNPQMEGNVDKDEDINTAREHARTFVMSDEYYSVSRREMIKAWHYLRRKEQGGIEEKIDIPATIEKIAKDGIFIEPQYQHAYINQEDTLIIFADSRGSMAPFHDLTNRLIQTALTEGGHPKAPIYYFHNYPVGYVYETPNLSRPIKIAEALSQANRKFSLALVISDAGAARGNRNETYKKTRLESTEKNFLEHLKARTAHTIWLNPMPIHRWTNTAAELIARQVTGMIPILEGETFNFHDMMRRTILPKNNN